MPDSKDTRERTGRGTTRQRRDREIHEELEAADDERRARDEGG